MDWNNDGLLDLITGEQSGAIRVYLRSAAGLNTYSAIKVGTTEFRATGGFSKPEVVDWNNDGKYDLVVGNGNGTVHLLLNTGTKAKAAFASAVMIRAGSADMSSGAYGRASPVVVDWNRDGKKDIILGETYGTLLYFENFGTDASPKFNADPASLKAGGKALNVGYYSRPEVVDWDNNGIKDIVCGNDQGQVYYFHAVQLSHTPVIDSLGCSSASVMQSRSITLTARNVTDAGGSVTKCEFYRDSNSNGVLDPTTDQLLGMGTANGANWVWAGISSDWPIGSNRFFARAYHSGEWSTPTTTTAMVQAPTLTGSPADDTYYIRLDGSGAYVQVFENAPLSGAPSYQIAKGVFNSLSIDGGTGDDVLTIDFSNGNPVGSGALSLSGGEGTDTVRAIGSSASDSLSLNAGQVVFGETPVAVGGIEDAQIEGGDGDDTLTIAAALSYVPRFNGGGGNNRLQVSAGTYRFDTNLGNGSKMSLDVGGSARVMLGSGQDLIGLTIGDSAKVSLTAGGSKVLRVRSLDLGAGTVLDLADHHLIVQAISSERAQVLARVTAWIQSARNTGVGRWQGSGITSSTAIGNALTGLAVMLNNKGGSPICESFAGQSVDANCVLVKYTWNGDVNLDGVIDAADYFRVDSGYITQAGGYGNGDLNFDDAVDAADYFLIDSAYIGQSGVLGIGRLECWAT